MTRPTTRVTQGALDHCIIVLTASVVFLFVPARMISHSPLEYAFLDPVVLSCVSLAFTLLYIALNVGAYWAARFLGDKNPASHILLFALFWVCGAGFLFPAVSSSAMVDARVAPGDTFNIILVALLSLGLTFAARTAMRRYVAVFLVVFIASAMLPTIPILYQFVRSDGTGELDHDTGSGIAALGREENVLVLSMDGLPGAVANRLIRDDPEFYARFKDFTRFENAVATSPATTASLLGEIYGNRDFKAVAETMDGILAKLDNSKLLMNDDEYDTYTYGEYNSFNNDGRRRVHGGQLVGGTSVIVHTADVFGFFEYVVARIGTRFLVRTLNKLARVVEPLVDRVLLAIGGMLSPGGGEFHEMEKRLLNHSGPWWVTRNTRTFFDFVGLVRNLRVGTAQKALRYLHFAYTHYPVDFDGACAFRGDDLEWFESNQNEAGITSEVECALKHMSQFLDRLEDLGLYERSLIVLKSDHGKPARYYSSPPENYRINEHDRWGYERYRPMLMIKVPSSRSSEPVVVRDLVLLDDLANTLCRAVTSRSDCDTFPGVDLLGDDLSSTEDFTMYVATDADSDFSIDYHKSVKLPRNRNLLQSMKASPGIQLSEAN